MVFPHRERVFPHRERECFRIGKECFRIGKGSVSASGNMGLREWRIENDEQNKQTEVEKRKFDEVISLGLTR